MKIVVTNKLLEEATAVAKVSGRTPEEQIEYWAKLGRAMEDNPDLPTDIIKGILKALEENDEELEEYHFG